MGCSHQRREAKPRACVDVCPRLRIHSKRVMGTLGVLGQALRACADVCPRLRIHSRRAMGTCPSLPHPCTLNPKLNTNHTSITLQPKH